MGFIIIYDLQDGYRFKDWLPISKFGLQGMPQLPQLEHIVWEREF